MIKHSPSTSDDVRFCIYVRKSEEADERQVLSIHSQLSELQALAERDKLNVVSVKTEAHSAKESGQRPVFMQMIEEIKAGRCSGILTWLPDRLSRNAGDLGKIVDLMDEGLLREIHTLNQVFRNQPNDKFLLMILCSQAKLENENRGINVKRGQRARASDGHRPCNVPVGYMLEYPAGTTKSRVVPDPVRAPIVRRIFRMADEGISGRKIRIWLDRIGFTTPTGKRMPLSMIQRMLHNVYYTGRFQWPEGSGEWYIGNYQRLVSKAMFERIQRRLALATRHRNPRRKYAFARMLRCDICGGGIAATDKYKELKDGDVRRYVYYCCSGAKGVPCKGMSIREDRLIEQLADIIDTVDAEMLGLHEEMEREIVRFERFAVYAMGHTPGTDKELPKATVHAYAKYILRKGTLEQKRALLAKLKQRLTLTVVPQVILDAK